RIQAVAPERVVAVAQISKVRSEEQVDQVYEHPVTKLAVAGHIGCSAARSEAAALYKVGAFHQGGYKAGDFAWIVRAIGIHHKKYLASSGTVARLHRCTFPGLSL